MMESIGINVATAFLTSKYFFYSLLFTFIFWFVWVNLNVLKNRLDKRTGIRKAILSVLFYVALPFGALIDVIYNKTVGTILFMEWGCETTLSMRMTRYISGRTCDKLGKRDYGYRVPVGSGFQPTSSSRGSRGTSVSRNTAIPLRRT